MGRVTSGAYGHTVGAAVGLALVEVGPGEPDELLGAAVAQGATFAGGATSVGDAAAAGDAAAREGAGVAVAVDVAGTKVPATLADRPFYDTAGARMRG